MAAGIYALTLDGTVFYVGQSKDIDKRYRQHCSINQNRGDRPVCKWITQLYIDGRSPTLQVIEETALLDEREIHWISHYREVNQDLLNVTDGGHSMLHFKRAKQNKPWSGTHSPIQRRLKGVKEGIRFFKRLGRDDLVARYERKLIAMNDAVTKVGRDRMNHELWSRHGN